MAGLIDSDSRVIRSKRGQVVEKHTAGIPRHIRIERTDVPRGLNRVSYAMIDRQASQRSRMRDTTIDTPDSRPGRARWSGPPHSSAPPAARTSIISRTFPRSMSLTLLCPMRRYIPTLNQQLATTDLPARATAHTARLCMAAIFPASPKQERRIRCGTPSSPSSPTV